MQNCQKKSLSRSHAAQANPEKVTLEFEMEPTFPLINYLFVNNLSDKKRRESENQTHGTKSTTVSRS